MMSYFYCIDENVHHSDKRKSQVNQDQLFFFIISFFIIQSLFVHFLYGSLFVRLIFYTVRFLYGSFFIWFTFYNSKFLFQKTLQHFSF